MADTLFRVDCKGSGGTGSGPFLNSYYINVDDSQALNAGLVTTAFKNYYTSLMPLYATTLFLTVPSAITQVATPPRIVPIVPQLLSGSGGATQDPPQLALVITWRTDLAGPSFRGRSYIGPLKSGSAPAGQFAGGTVTTAQNAATALLTAINALTGHHLVVYSRFHNKQERPTAVVTPITSAVARQTAYTQRRRQVR
jgi:hypothetical protein